MNAQFCDVGSQYSPATFVHDEMQRRLAEESKRAVARQLQKPVVTDIVAATQFWPAEDYHQDSYKKNLIRYKVYRTYCGRGGQRGDSTSNWQAEGYPALVRLGGLIGCTIAAPQSHLDSLGLCRSVKLPAAPMLLHEPGPSA